MTYFPKSKIILFWEIATMALNRIYGGERKIWDYKLLRFV